MGIKANEVVEFLFGFNSMAKSYFGVSFVLRPVLKARSVSAGTLPDYTLLHFCFKDLVNLFSAYVVNEIILLRFLLFVFFFFTSVDYRSANCLLSFFLKNPSWRSIIVNRVVNQDYTAVGFPIFMTPLFHDNFLGPLHSPNQRAEWLLAAGYR